MEHALNFIASHASTSLQPPADFSFGGRQKNVESIDISSSEALKGTDGFMNCGNDSTNVQRRKTLKN